jgi:hypothetical protein
MSSMPSTEPLLQALQVCGICFTVVAGLGFVLYLVLLFRECFTLIGNGRDGMAVSKERLQPKTAVYSIDRHASFGWEARSRRAAT